MDNLSLDNRVQEYHNNGEINEDFLGGHIGKVFVRLDDNKDKFKLKQKKLGTNIEKTDKDSHFFGELFRDLLSGKSHYITYLNRTIVGKKKKDITIPQHISCLLKNVKSEDLCYCECVGSRLANEMGVDTVYNIPARRNNKELDEEDEYNRYDTVISVDYIPWGYMTANLTEFDLFFTENTLLEEILTNIDKNIPTAVKKFKINITEDQLTKFKRDFARLYLFRQVMCDDFDLEDKNVSVLYSKDGDFKLGPCFDMEFFFAGGKSYKWNQKVVQETIKSIRKTMPDVLEEFVAKYDALLESGRLNDIIYKTMEADKYFKETAKTVITHNMDILKQEISKVNYTPVM